jgi:hypothetical protein
VTTFGTSIHLQKKASIDTEYEYERESCHKTYPKMVIKISFLFSKAFELELITILSPIVVL